jgi:hypothetical protein
MVMRFLPTAFVPARLLGFFERYSANERTAPAAQESTTKP